MPSNNSTGASSAGRCSSSSTFDGLVDFFGALFDTARNWGDTELMAMPGYRDRVVHVKLAEDEGGLNLSMPPQIINALGERGELAGKLLAGRFAPMPTRKRGPDRSEDRCTCARRGTITAGFATARSWPRWSASPGALGRLGTM